MNKNKSVTLIIDESQKNKIIEHYLDYKKDNTGEYIEFFAKKNDIAISIYSSKKKNEYKILFIGTNPLDEAKLWDKNAKENVSKKRNISKARWLCLDDQIGSDEVGTGDLFGPIIVVASFVKKSDITYLKNLGVDDSKRLSDEEIVNIGSKLINKVMYSHIYLNNEKYNNLILKGMNMNEIKCHMHNQALLNLHKKYPEIKAIFVDQFNEVDKYYYYLKNTSEVVKDITFKTKGESYFPSIAVSSIIARYSFLKKMAEIGKKYGKVIPFGASKNVTSFALNFAKAYGKDELYKITKRNFSNLKEINF